MCWAFLLKLSRTQKTRILSSFDFLISGFFLLYMHKYYPNIGNLKRDKTLMITFPQNEKNNPLMIMKRHLVYNRPSIAVPFLTFQKRVINPLLKLKTIEYFLKKIEKISFENLHYNCDFFNCENSSDCLTLLKIEYSLWIAVALNRCKALCFHWHLLQIFQSEFPLLVFKSQPNLSRFNKNWMMIIKKNI